MCQTHVYDNIKVNVDRMLLQNPNRDNKSFSSDLLVMAQKMRSEFLTRVIVYDELLGPSKHALACTFCISILHANKKYNINIAYLLPEAGPNSVAVKSTNPKKFVEKH